MGNLIFAGIIALAALSISVMAAYFSVIGLSQLFVGAAVAIIILGGLIEAGKIVAVLFLHRFWNDKTLKWHLKSFLTTCVFIVMVITSLGIFGFLSSAHLEQTSNVQLRETDAQLARESISPVEREIEQLTRIMDQLDSALQEMIDRGFATRALDRRDEQAEQRARIESRLTELYAERTALQRAVIESEQEVRAVELEVGPLIYVANMIYGEADKSQIEEAVRWLIIIIIVVFDPFALSLLMAAQWTWLRGKAIETQNRLEKQRFVVTPDASHFDEIFEEEPEDEEEIKRRRRFRNKKHTD